MFSPGKEKWDFLSQASHLSLSKWLTSRQMLLLVRVRFDPKTIFFSSCFKFKSFSMNFIELNSQFLRFSKKSHFFGGPLDVVAQKNVKIMIISEFDEIRQNN